MRSKEHDMQALGHCHCSAMTKDKDMVEMDVVKCKDGWFAVYDHWGDGGYGSRTYVARFRKEEDAYLFVYRRLRDVHGPIIIASGAGCPNEFLKEFDLSQMEGR